jgi:uncharacterized protein with FMN-binding domain
MPNSLPTSSAAFSRVPRRGAVALVTTVLAVLLLFSFKTGDQATIATSLPSDALVGAPPQATTRPVAGSSGPTQPPTAGATAVPTQPTVGSAGESGTFTGDPVDTAYGTVQIALIVQAGQIVDVQELQMPFDRRLSQQISAEAGPLLRRQVLRAQSADINGVSGASYTSYGYWQSLQSAIAQM